MFSLKDTQASIHISKFIICTVIEKYEAEVREEFTEKRITTLDLNRCYSLMNLNNSAIFFKNEKDYIKEMAPPILLIPLPRRLKQEHFDFLELKNLLKLPSVRINELFPVPVITADGKFICRASDVQTGYTFGTDFENGVLNDIKLLDMFKIDTLISFTLNSKRIEKEQQLYYKFKYVSMPLPKQFYELEKLNFKAHKINAYCIGKGIIDVSQLAKQPFDFFPYDDIDLLDLMTRYLKTILFNLKSKKHSGFLFQSYYGELRTSMFISLIRLCLWAEGVIHESLDAPQIMYLTLVYDWFIFNSNYRENIQNRGALRFCFNMLKVLIDGEYMLKSNPSLNYIKCRENNMLQLVDIFHSLYPTIP